MLELHAGGAHVAAVDGDPAVLAALAEEALAESQRASVEVLELLSETLAPVAAQMLDADHDGDVTAQETLEFFDTDHDGAISAEELKRGLASLDIDVGERRLAGLVAMTSGGAGLTTHCHPSLDLWGGGSTEELDEEGARVRDAESVLEGLREEIVAEHGEVHMLFLVQHKAVGLPEGEALDMAGVEAALAGRALAAAALTRTFAPLLRDQDDEGSHLVYISPLPASALSAAPADLAEASGWGALAAAAAGAALAGIAGIAAADVAARAPHVEVTNVHVAWPFGPTEENRATAGAIVRATKRGVRRLVIGPEEKTIDSWARLLPGRAAGGVGGTEGWLGQLVRGSVAVGKRLGRLSRGDWAALAVGLVVGEQIAAHHLFARL